MPGTATVNFTDGFDERKLKRVLPSWLISLVLHSVLFAFLTLGFFRPGLPDGALNGNGLGAGGLVLEADFGQGGGTRLSNQSAGDGDGGDATELPSEQDSPAILIPETRPAADSVATTQRLLDLPKTSGVGATRHLPLDVPKSGTSRPTIRTAATGGLRGNGRGGRGTGVGGAGGGSGGTGNGSGKPGFGRIDGTSFFQVAAQGEHFCYVVDCSSSMDGGAMGLAKAELMASIERLDSEKKFQILFYNSEIYPMTNGRDEDLFHATETNRLFARKFINNQQPDNSTLHRPALTAALRFAPDVIFFLTDGDIPELDAKDLQDLKRINGSNTQINVIQFGQGPKLGPTNWLERLAKDHRGTYRYRDIDSLSRG